MITALDILLRLIVWLLLAPLLPGVINKVKAWVAGRRGPPVLQLYYDLAKLWRKGVVLSTAVSPGHVAGTAVAWVAIVSAATMPSMYMLSMVSALTPAPPGRHAAISTP